MSELPAKSVDHLSCVGFPFIEWFQRNKHPCGVRTCAAYGERRHGVHVGIAPDNVDHFRQLIPHGLKRDVLLRLNRTSQAARVLFREEAFRNDKEEADIDADGDQYQSQHKTGVAQRPAKRHVVATTHPVENPLARPVEGSVGSLSL